jgi:hypothetical protein
VSIETIDVTAEYEEARRAALSFDPGHQPSIRDLMIAAYIHGYARALLDNKDKRGES